MIKKLNATLLALVALALVAVLLGANETSTAVNRFTKLYTSNVTAASITAPSATATEPALGSGVFDLRNRTTSPNQMAFVFFSTRTSADNETATARITGWRRIGDVWTPVPLLSLNLTAGAMTGVSGELVSNTEYFTDTITVASAFTSAYEIISPGNDQVAVVKLDVFGCELVDVDLGNTTTASINAAAAGY